VTSFLCRMATGDKASPPVFEASLYVNLYASESRPVSCRLTWKTLSRAPAPEPVRYALLLVTPVAYLAYCRDPKRFKSLHPLAKRGGKLGLACGPAIDSRPQVGGYSHLTSLHTLALSVLHHSISLYILALIMHIGGVKWEGSGCGCPCILAR
jgi:hypothetical protein